MPDVTCVSARGSARIPSSFADGNDSVPGFGRTLRVPSTQPVRVCVDSGDYQDSVAFGQLQQVSAELC